MAQLHTWAGLLPGWLLFVIFLFGTTAFFQQEISRWMRPELSTGAVSQKALDRAAVHLSNSGKDATHWTISLPSDRGGEPLTISWEQRGAVGEGLAGELKLDPGSGRPVGVRDTSGGWFLYRFHYDLHYMPVMWARLLVCIAALAMLVAILSGIVTHKKIFADFFLLRFGKGQRSWLDAHNVTAVLALPFHLMITYTGLVALLFTLMPWAIRANYPTPAAYYEAVSPAGPIAEASGRGAAMLSLTELVARAERALADSDPGLIIISHPGDANAIVEVWPHFSQLAGPRSPVFLNGVTGEVMQAPPMEGGARVAQTVMVDLHAGRFSGPVLRWLYFLSGVAGAVMVASGLVLWVVKRRAKLPDPAKPHFGFQLVERLNIGVIGGAPAGIAAYFIANRLLPLDLANRADWEINSLFVTWGGLFVWTIARPAKRAWIEALLACATLYGLAPVVNALTTPRGLIPSLLGADWVFVGFDGVMLAMAVICSFTAWKIAQNKPRAAPRRKHRAMMETTA